MNKDKYPHYYKKVPGEYIDVYRVLDLFEVTDPCIQHAIKKLLAAGKRGAKDVSKDVREAIVSLERWQEMRKEEESCAPNVTTTGYIISDDMLKTYYPETMNMKKA